MEDTSACPVFLSQPGGGRGGEQDGVQEARKGHPMGSWGMVEEGLPQKALGDGR
jgi:hypothetical protein